MRIRFGPCTLDTDSRVLVRDGQPVHLTPKAYQLLAHLLEVRPRAVSKSELQETLWPDTFVTEGNLATLVKETRAAIGDDAHRPVYIRTVHGFGYAFSGEADAAEEAVHSVVVLPFENGTGDRELDYLCDGIAEDVTNAFSRLVSFRVLSHATAAHVSHCGAGAEAIGRELGVQTVIHGRITTAKNELVIQAQAVDVCSATQIWGNRFRCRSDEVLRIESEVTAEIVDALRLRLSADDRSRLVHRYTSNAHAYDLYLRGRFQWNKRTEEALRKAIRLFEASVVADPGYALPYCGIADVWTTMATRDLVAPREAFSSAFPAAARALELMPDLAEAHTSLGAIAEVHQWDWGEAGRKYRRAIELSPSYATAHQWYALHLARCGRPVEADVQMSMALEVDRLSLIGVTNAALIAYLGRDGAAAAERAERALEMEPDSVEALLVRGNIREANRQLDAAIEDYEIAVARSPRYTIGLGLLGHAFARRGRRNEAESILQKLESERGEEYVSATAPALIHLGLDHHHEFFEWMEKALRDRSGWLIYLKTDPRLDPVRGNARFERLLEAVGFES